MSLNQSKLVSLNEQIALDDEARIQAQRKKLRAKARRAKARKESKSIRSIIKKKVGKK